MEVDEKTEVVLCRKLIQRMVENDNKEMSRLRGKDPGGPCVGSEEWVKEAQAKLLDLVIHLERSIRKQPGGGNAQA
jgi:hypothetical protein